MKRTSSKQIALCGVLAALALVVMILGGMFPAATYCCPVLACVMLVPVVNSCGRRIAWAWYGAVAILSSLLCPDVEAAAMFVFLGYYPILKSLLDRISLRLLRVLVKLALFNVATAVMYGVLIYLLSLEAVAAEFQNEAPWVLILTLLLGNLTFICTDFLLTRLERLYRQRFGKKIKP